MNVVYSLVILVASVRAKSPVTTEAYLDSFTIQDSCQFSLCGPEYSQEFLLGNIYWLWKLKEGEALLL